MWRQGGVAGGIQLPLVEFVLENVVHPFVRPNTGRIGPFAGSFQPFRGVTFGQAKHAQASTVSLLRVTASVQGMADQFGSLLTDLSGPVQKALW